MSDKPDTSWENVLWMAALYSDTGPRDDDKVAALLRALLAERDAAFQAGAEVMREEVASMLQLRGMSVVADAIRALPLPERKT